MAYGTANGFSALGDPTRRAIFERLAGGPRSVGELAAELPVSRPAVSQHLKVLKAGRAGRATGRDGTRRLYRVDPGGVGAMRDYLDRFWDQALTAFKAAVEGPDDKELSMSNATIAPVRRSVFVQAPPERAFELFTERLRLLVAAASHSVIEGGQEAAIIEPRGRRTLVRAQGKRRGMRTGDGCWCTSESSRLVLSWLLDENFDPDPDESKASEVEVTFTPEGDGTRVELVHSGFERRGGEPGEGVASRRRGRGRLERAARALRGGRPGLELIGLGLGEAHGRVGRHEQRRAGARGGPGAAALVVGVVDPGGRAVGARVGVDRAELPVGAVLGAVGEADVRPAGRQAEQVREVAVGAVLPARAPDALEARGQAGEQARGRGARGSAGCPRRARACSRRGRRRGRTATARRRRRRAAAAASGAGIEDRARDLLGVVPHRHVAAAVQA